MSFFDFIDGNSDDDQRLRNFLMTKMYVTDNELESMAPFVAIILVVAITIAVFCMCFGGNDKKQQIQPPSNVEQALPLEKLT